MTEQKKFKNVEKTNIARVTYLVNIWKPEETISDLIDKKIQMLVHFSCNPEACIICESLFDYGGQDLYDKYMMHIMEKSWWNYTFSRNTTV